MAVRPDEDSDSPNVQSGDGEHSDEGEHSGQDEPDRWLNRATLTRRGALIGMAAVGGVAAVDVGVFAYAGGWLTPDEADAIAIHRPVRAGRWAPRRISS